MEACESRRLLAADGVASGATLHNPSAPFDVNADQIVSLADALCVAYALRNGGAETARAFAGSASPLYADVTGDGRVTRHDLHATIAHLAALRDARHVSPFPFEDDGDAGDGSGRDPTGGKYYDDLFEAEGSGSGGGGSLEIFDAQANEEEGTITFTVKFTGSYPGGFTVDYRTLDHTAIGEGSGSGTGVGVPDFTHVRDVGVAFAGTNNETQEITIDLLDDNVVELDEYFKVVLDAIHNGSGVPVSGITFADSEAEGTIVNTDSAVVYAQLVDGVTLEPLAGGAIDEGNPVINPPRAVALRLTLSNPVDVDVVVGAATGGGTAVADNDYAALEPNASSSKATLPKGTVGSQSAGSISVIIYPDQVVELDETFNLSATSIAAQGRNVTFSGSSAPSFPITITNDDTATVSVAWFNNLAQVEGGPLTFRVSLDSQVDAPVVVSLQTVAGTASAGSGDYAAAIGETVAFSAYSTTPQDFIVTTHDDDIVESETETMSLAIAAISAGGRTAIGVGGIAAGQIRDNDSALVSVGSSMSASEGNGGTSNPTPFSFTINVSRPVDVALNVTYHTVAVSAMGSGPERDFVHVAAGGTATIAALDSSGTIVVSVIGDINDEDAETFQVFIDDVTPVSARDVGVNPNADVSTATILDDD